MSDTTTNSPLTGQYRWLQTPLYDTLTIPAAATATSYQMFGNINGSSGVGLDTTNMDAQFKLTDTQRFTVRSMRFVVHGVQADIDAFQQKYAATLKVAGIDTLLAPVEFWTGGAGSPAGGSNGIGDPRAVAYFDTDPIDISEGLGLKVQLNGTSFTPSAALQVRCYLDGRMGKAA